jgi:hypothetical protein
MASRDGYPELPAFEGRLTDEQVEAILARVKIRWEPEQRQHRAGPRREMDPALARCSFTAGGRVATTVCHPEARSVKGAPFENTKLATEPRVRRDPRRRPGRLKPGYGWAPGVTPEERESDPGGQPGTSEQLEDGRDDESSYNDADVEFMQGMVPHHMQREFDLLWVDAMIDHHRGAVDSADRLIDDGEHPRVRELAEDIISEQEREIEQMRTWQDEWERS